MSWSILSCCVCICRPGALLALNACPEGCTVLVRAGAGAGGGHRTQERWPLVGRLALRAPSAGVMHEWSVSSLCSTCRYLSMFYLLDG